jgi:dolichyl-phosphate-mannose--protein O-mannosyl transferase
VNSWFKWLGALLVTVVAWFCFVQNRGDPALLFWDENYHVTSAERYLEGYAQLTPHPPLGLLLIALGERWSGANRNIDKHVLTVAKSIKGEQLPPGFQLAGFRLMPAIFAAAAALFFYALMFEITASPVAATLLAGLYLFENAFIVHFRAAHLDGIEMAFIVASLWWFVRCWKQPGGVALWRYGGLALLLSLALMVKANAAFLLLLPVLLWLHDGRRFFHGVYVALLSVVTAVAVVALVMSAHVLTARQLPQLNTPAGVQDYPLMSAAFRGYAAGGQRLSARVLYAAARDEWRAMQIEHHGAPRRRLNDATENGSAPWHWPFHDRNINYRWDSAYGRTAYVELAGNQLAWYCGTLAMAAALVMAVRRRLLPRVLPRSMRKADAPDGDTVQLLQCCAALYALFMLMNAYFDSQRVMYLYHYLPGLLLSYLALALWWQYARENWLRFGRQAFNVLGAAMAASFLCFAFFLPLTNHQPLSKAQCEQRNVWISKILDCY